DHNTGAARDAGRDTIRLLMTTISRRAFLSGLGAIPIADRGLRIADSGSSLGPSLNGQSTVANQSAVRNPQSAMPRLPFNVSVLTDEISQDVGRACEVASKEFGLAWVDLREMHGKNIMKWDAADIAEVRKVLQRFSLRVACLASPIY